MKWRETSWRCLPRMSWSHPFEARVAHTRKPRIFVLGEDRFPSSWAPWFRARAARRRLYGASK